ncbi:UTP--glucose-1-phosphate uridylyltransferase, partial [bacterium]
MTNALIETITSESDSVRNRSISSLLHSKTRKELLGYGDELDSFRINSNNLYHKVRASLFLFVIYRFYLQEHEETPPYGEIPFQGVKAAYKRDFEKSIGIYRREMSRNGKNNGALFSAVADSYYKLSFQYLLDQVKLSISNCRENIHLYQIQGLSDYPFSVSPEMITPDDRGLYPVGVDMSPVRLDPSHSGWSDIFFLGMDFPEGAKVINISVNLKVHGTEDPLAPPCECYCHYIEEPVLHLVSVDLQTSKKIS